MCRILSILSNLIGDLSHLYLMNIKTMLKGYSIIWFFGLTDDEGLNISNERCVKNNLYVMYYSPL